MCALPRASLWDKRTKLANMIKGINMIKAINMIKGINTIKGARAIQTGGSRVFAPCVLSSR